MKIKQRNCDIINFTMMDKNSASDNFYIWFLIRETEYESNNIKKGARIFYDIYIINFIILYIYLLYHF